MLSGSIFITDNINLVRSTPDNVIIIYMEDMMDNGYDLQTNNRVIVGSCLLPPVDCYMAEADGNEELYNYHYTNWLLTPEIESFMGAILSLLYKNVSILIYTSQIDSVAISKFRKLIYTLYGIGIGIAGSESYYYDPSCLPMWLNILYCMNLISNDEFLIKYPNTKFSPHIIEKLCNDYQPVGNSVDDCIEEIVRHQLRLKENNTVKFAIMKARG